ncbi:hypothetical protein CONLIGDRAFT_683805 [Coniochaeta ligniaria NRRL 30616]|uniref:RRM domain-containing protein n=1 Tax=Coniochaeta ligniaria NRRL 30616 TaxID=1408157 RepID=A0A1J7JAS3_9PEZI|nr:hypothetical protein CONLIGDRAFT_683805 [Coniochaeta ligniaria NRRL 30616]
MKGDVHELFALFEWSNQVLAHRSVIHLERQELIPASRWSPRSPVATWELAAPPWAGFTDPNNTTVFVGGLSGYVTEDELRPFFQGFGEITYVKIPPGKGCGQRLPEFEHLPSSDHGLQSHFWCWIASQRPRPFPGTLKYQHDCATWKMHEELWSTYIQFVHCHAAEMANARLPHRQLSCSS